MAYRQTRRDFLKITTASLIPGSLGALGEFSFQGEDKYVRSTCEMCSSRCPIEVRVVDGKPVCLQGNAYAKASGSSICARGIAGVSQLYDQDRLVTPLIRVGKRGENRWREVSYEEALDVIASRLETIKQTYGAQSVLFSSKTGEEYELLRSFSSNFGSPNIFSHWSSCPIAIECSFEQTFGERLHRDFGQANYILNFGHNLFEGLDIPLSKAMAHFAADASKKLVVFDPRFSIMAGKADEWHPIKPGQDLAFLLSLIHVWIRDDKYDKTFVKRYCNGFDALRRSVKEATPQWQEPLSGIAASVVERIADEVYRAAPRCIIDWGHKATTSPAEFQRTRAIMIANVLMGNIERHGGIYMAKTPERLNALLGEMMLPVLQNPFPTVSLNVPRIDGAGEASPHRFVPSKHGVLTAIPDAILSQKPYTLKGWFLTRHNPLITVADPGRMREAMETLDLIVVNDIYLSETAMMADVVLPESTYLERDEGVVMHTDKTVTYTMRNRAIDPLSQTKSFHEIIIGLAHRLGFADVYPWKTIPQLRLYQTKGETSLLENLMAKGYVHYEMPELFSQEPSSVQAFCERYPHANRFVSPRGTIELFLNDLKTSSKKIDLFCPNVEALFQGYGTPGIVAMDVKGAYPYTLISGKSAVHTNGHTQNIPYLHHLMPDNPIWMHPLTAKANGLKANDTCYIENDIGKEKVRIFITEGIRPDTLFLYMGFGMNHVPRMHLANQKGSSASKLLSLRPAPVCGAMITNIGVRILKASDEK